MKNNTKQEGIKDKTADFCNDFKALSAWEKRGVLKTARTYRKLLRENNALLTDTPIPPLETETQGLA